MVLHKFNQLQNQQQQQSEQITKLPKSVMCEASARILRSSKSPALIARQSAASVQSMSEILTRHRSSEKLQKIREAAEHEQLKDCTFKPRLNDTSKAKVKLYNVKPGIRTDRDRLDIEYEK